MKNNIKFIKKIKYRTPYAYLWHKKSTHSRRLFWLRAVKMTVYFVFSMSMWMFHRYTKLEVIGWNSLIGQNNWLLIVIKNQHGRYMKISFKQNIFIAKEFYMRFNSLSFGAILHTTSIEFGSHHLLKTLLYLLNAWAYFNVRQH